MEQKEQMKRQIAIKLPLSKISDGKYFKSDSEPNFLLIDERFKISRINIMGIIIEKEDDPTHASLIIDDSTSKISIRIFDASDIKRMDNLEIGDAAMIIGKPREYNSEIYIIPEIIRKIEKREWLKYRQLELENQKIEEITEKIEMISLDTPKKIASNTEEIFENFENDPSENPYDKYLAIIKEFDSKDGAPTESVIKKIDELGEKGEQIIEKLLKEGEIFEIRAGRIKILG